MSQLTQSQMKYLHVIYKIGKDGDLIRVVDIARALKLSRASVSRMLRRLEERGFLSLTKYKNIELTQQGMLEGCNLHEKIGLVYPFFADHLELDEQDALDSAYSFLCFFPDNCFSMLLTKGWVVAKI